MSNYGQKLKSPADRFAREVERDFEHDAGSAKLQTKAAGQRRQALLMTTARLISVAAISSLTFATGLPSPTWADGGAGGGGTTVFSGQNTSPGAGGMGGPGYDGEPGTNGGNGSDGMGGPYYGGGGGGGGAGGGMAGLGGASGTDGSGGSGGNGGSNGNGNGAPSIANTTPLSGAGGAGGGNGGPGGTAGGGGGGGGGGAGGYGAIVTGAGTNSNTSSIAAGSGGRGGNTGFGTAGNGGDGGVGLQFSATGNILTNSGSISGGNGGGAGSALGLGGISGTAGLGGAGIVGAGLTIINSGAISGGTGRAGQANAITFTGGTNTLTTNMGANSPGSYTGNIVNNFGGLTLSQTAAAGANASATYANTISVTGDLLVQSDGGRIVRLTGNTIAGGAVTISPGTLEADGSINATAINVNSGGMLSGTGNVSSTSGTIAGGGVLSPGSTANPYGTLAVTGPLTFAAGSFYNIAITPTQNSRTNVSGNTMIAGGTVNVAAGAGHYATRQYTILNATGNVTGTFTGVTSNLAFLMPTLTYDAHDVFLNITGNGANGSVNYRTAAATQNQYNVASGLTEAGKSMPGGAGGRILDGLNQLTVGQAQAAFDALSGEGITATQNLANRSAQLFNDAIFDQTTFYGSGGAGNQIVLTDAPPAFTAYAPLTGERAPLYGPPVRELADLPAAHIAPTFVAPARTWRAWATGFGGTEDIHGNGAIGSAAQDNTIYGGALGVDYQLMPNYLFGVAVGGSDGDFQVPGRTTYGSTTGGHIAIYDLATFGSFYGASSSSFSYFTNRTTRFVGGFGGLGSETERGDFDSHEYRTRLEFGRHFDGFGVGTLTPFVALEIAELRSNGFGETSVSGPGLFRLNVSGQSAADVPGYLGLRYQTVMPLGGMTFLPSLQVAYVHEFAPYRSQTGAIADLPGSTFLVDGARPARDAAQVKAGGELKIGPNSALFANFDGEFSGVNQLYAGKGGLRWVW